MYKVTIEVSDTDLIDVVAENSMEIIVQKIYDTLNTTHFIEYLTKKFSASLHKIAQEQLSTVNTQEDIDASFKNGILVVSAPKKKEIETKKTISIKDSE